MKVIVVATRKQDAKPEAFAPYLESEANMALSLYRDEHIREIYSREDGNAKMWHMPNGCSANCRWRRQACSMPSSMAPNPIAASSST
jgi:hypothetical protein